ncbi:FAD/NAD(P)-binding protein [Bradyrhizobium sp. CER78]|uniref:FAD/NAD(P)-binding protein n=1 Tax=Bradyrhizobium sp. CER78 TaxID=3039162 RepID=UPI0024494DA6|nr:FAD/NAD(P)-binding protein [Bradyrhizobium sp. CER78]MDH2383633.1 FAD/NAD(P)-binding protein [Bradyrhizobium sp. CER78]
MTGPGGRHVIIVGGGASGVLLTYQLLHRSSCSLRVTLIEQRPDIGRGIAYHTGNPDHLLNVRAANMSALPDQPDHFWRWLVSRQDGIPICPDPYCFVPRRVYGDYIASLLDRGASDCADEQRLTIVHSRCIDVSSGPDEAVAALEDGRRIVGDTIVLATGHDMRASSPGRVDPWTPPSAAPIDVNAAVLILGTGLTMVDYVLSLLRDGHRGPIIATSRRGLLARPHRRVDSMRIAEAEVPFGASIATLLSWIRARVAQHAAQGGDWRGVIDGLRPYTQRLWHELPLSSKRRFLEHARAWWDVHRHRMAPELESRITAALFSGQLNLMAAKVIKIEPNRDGAKVTYRRRGAAETHHLQVGAVVDCTGIVKDPTATPNSAVRSLFERGLACVDPLRIGIEIHPSCAIVDSEGVPSERLFAVGPLTRATFWEIIAIPDIRNQCAELAALLSREETGQLPTRRELSNV